MELYLGALPTEDRRGMTAARELRIRRRRAALPRTHTNKPLTITPHVITSQVTLRYRAVNVALLGVCLGAAFEAKNVLNILVQLHH